MSDFISDFMVAAMLVCGVLSVGLVFALLLRGVLS
jgi:hypothetical protein